MATMQDFFGTPSTKPPSSPGISLSASTMGASAPPTVSPMQGPAPHTPCGPAPHTPRGPAPHTPLCPPPPDAIEGTDVFVHAPLTPLGPPPPTPCAANPDVFAPAPLTPLGPPPPTPPAAQTDEPLSCPSSPERSHPKSSASGQIANFRAGRARDEEAKDWLNIVDKTEASFADEVGHDHSTTDDDVMEDPEVKRWKELADHGVDVRSAEGQRFSRDAAGGRSSDYKFLSHSDKKLFRQKWAQKIWEDLKVRREKKVSYKQADVSKGVYTPFSVLVREEGDDDAGLRAARNYAASCRQMGGSWVRFNKMTQRTEYLYMKSHVYEEFEKSWAVYEESKKVEKGVTQTDAPKVKSNDPRGGPPKVKDPKGGPPKSETPKEKSSLDTALATATKLLRAYQSTTSQATTMQKSITEGPEWSWAQGTTLATKQAQFLEEVESCTRSPFARNLLSDPKNIKNSAKHSVLLQESVAFAAAIEEPLDRLQKLSRKLLSMHREQLKAD